MHVSFTLVLTVLTLLLSCVPAIVIWVLFSDLMNSTIDLFSTTTANGTGALSASVQDLLLRNSLLLLNARITAGNSEALSQQSLLFATGLVNLNIRPNATNLQAQVLDRIRGYNFNALTGNTRLSYISMEGTYFNNDSTPGKTSYWIVWQTINIDIVKAQMGVYLYGRTLYLCTVLLAPDEQVANMQIWYVDQTTGMPLVQLSSVNYSWQAFAYSDKDNRRSWGSDLYVNPYSGQVELTYVETVFVGDRQFAIGLGLNTQTLSEELRSQLAGQPNDRLFLFFCNAKGHLIAASHGKYFSLSDKDLRYVNAVANPPNLSAYQLYTCLDSNDTPILEACQNLIALYGDWTRIPESRQEMALASRRYWVAVGYSSSTLAAAMVLLKDRQAIMGGIDASTATVQRDTDAKRGAAGVVLGVAATVTTVVPLLIGVWLSRRLLRLARGMDRIAQLDFTGVCAVSQARFQEIHDFQESFLQMERGLRAFGKFVPSAVVTRLVAGNIHTDDQMETATVTIMFADIEGFSMLAEALAPTQLVEVCTEYFEVLCKHVVHGGGTIDKFIGDCVMALWNVPLQQTDHERSAVTAALLMQAEVLLLHDVWRQRTLPPLRFRLGVHTGRCLVGNFGCSHRVSYTCLGASVNLAARLESLNKKFGTVLCVSEATRAGCRAAFHFRHLSRVTVPGMSNVLSVYEVICAAQCEEGDDEREEGDDEQTTSGRTPSRSPGTYQVRSPGDSGDVSPRMSSRTDIQLERLETPKGKERVRPTPPPGTSPRAEGSGGRGCSRDASSANSSEGAKGIPYHWAWRPRQDVLREVAEYEAAYAALVEGRYQECCRALARGQLDPAWQALEAQLGQPMGGNQPWDGVLHFTHK